MTTTVLGTISMDRSDEIESASTAGSSNDTSKSRSSGGGLSDWTDALRDMAPYLDLGWRVAGAAAFPPLIGYFAVDALFGTMPWGLLSGCVLGLAASVLQLKRLQEDLDQ